MARKKSNKKEKKAKKKMAVKKTAAKAKGAKASKKSPAKAKMRAVRPAAKKAQPAVRPAASPPRRDPIAALAKKLVELTISGNDDAALAYYAESIESSEGSMPATRGLQALREKFQMWHSMVRQASWRARSVATSGNSIVVEWSGTVTFNSTGKTIELNEVAIHEIANAKIVRERFYYDPSVMQAAMTPDATSVS